MDGQRFDALTRRLAAPRSRRRVLGAILAAAGGGLIARLEQAAAQACAGPGVACTATGECCPGGTCANGVCCFTDGWACGSSTPGACCAGYACDGDPGQCAACQDPGAACTSNAQCCTTGVCTSFGRCSGECAGDGDCTGGKTCQEGVCVCPAGLLDCSGTCQECCSAFDCDDFAPCNDGVCQTCWQFGGPCQSDGDCCQDQFSLVCGDSGTCNVACLPETANCGAAGDPPCCENLTCSVFGACVPACTSAGRVCNINGACCPGLTCFENGLCGDPNSCADQGESCSGVTCCGALICGGSPAVCGACKVEGVACTNSGISGCCDDLRCRNDICVPRECRGVGRRCDEANACCLGVACVEGVCTPSTCPGAGSACEQSADCCIGLFCHFETKVCTQSTGCGNNPGDSCAFAEDCCGAVVCDLQLGLCVVPPDCAGASAACGGSTTCCLGLTCQAGVCAEPTGDCAGNADCPPGQVCVNGACVAPSTTPPTGEAPATATEAAAAGTAISLPNTGAGPTNDPGSNNWLGAGAAALAGALAVFSGSKRHGTNRSDTDLGL